MTKKVTTIVLLVVILILVASAIYISIILVNDNSTAAKPSRADEIPFSVLETNASISPDPLAQDIQTQDTTQVDPAADTPSKPIASDPLVLDMSTPTPDLLAYNNPTSVPTEETLATDPTPTLPPLDLPETGGTNPTVMATPTVLVPTKALNVTSVPTKAFVTTVQQIPQGQSMPVAGNFFGPALTAVVAGVSIVAAFFL